MLNHTRTCGECVVLDVDERHGGRGSWKIGAGDVKVYAWYKTLRYVIRQLAPRRPVARLCVDARDAVHVNIYAHRRMQLYRK